MKDTLHSTNIIQPGDKIKFRNLYCYHMEKIKNCHLEQKDNQNKVNEMFALHSKMVKTFDPKELTQKLTELVNVDNMGRRLGNPKTRSHWMRTTVKRRRTLSTTGSSRTTRPTLCSRKM